MRLVPTVRDLSSPTCCLKSTNQPSGWFFVWSDLDLWSWVQVYRARQVSVDRDVAVKVMRAEFSRR